MLCRNTWWRRALTSQPRPSRSRADVARAFADFWRGRPALLPCLRLWRVDAARQCYNVLRGSIPSARSTLRQSDPQAYGRLGQLLPAVDEAIDHAVENRAALDQIAVRRGLMSPQQAIQAKLERTRSNVVEPKPATMADRGIPSERQSRTISGWRCWRITKRWPNKPKTWHVASGAGIPEVSRGTASGASETAATGSSVAAPNIGDSVFTPSGRQVGVQYRVVEGKHLVTSNNPDMTPNSEFPQEPQPRDRGRAASETQVSRIAGQLQPERLGASCSVGEVARSSGLTALSNPAMDACSGFVELMCKAAIPRRNTAGIWKAKARYVRHERAGPGAPAHFGDDPRRASQVRAGGQRGHGARAFAERARRDRCRATV